MAAGTTCGARVERDDAVVPIEVVEWSTDRRDAAEAVLKDV